MTWTVRLICCGRDDGSVDRESWDGADAFRNDYIEAGQAVGHERVGIVASCAKHGISCLEWRRRKQVKALLGQVYKCIRDPRNTRIYILGYLGRLP